MAQRFDAQQAPVGGKADLPQGGQIAEAGKPASASDSFERGTASEGRGSYTAPYAGIHGWFWENAGETPVTVTVTTAGFYTAAKEFRDDGTTAEHPVQDLPAPARPAAP